jgi:biotin-dependent carboxylase-like uncharacterized protein
VSRALTVCRAGAQTLVQDTGRPGHAHLGVPPSGALDQLALALANRLVGNDGPAAGLEVLAGGLQLRAEGSLTVAVTGALAPLWVAGRPAERLAPVHLAAGDVLEIGPATGGLRCYVAVSGGIAVPCVLGSRSTDTLSGLGPEPLADGTRLPLGAPGLPRGADACETRRPQGRAPVRLGPRDGWFDDPAGVLRAGSWTVSERSDRIALRLHGTALTRRELGELPSEALLTGAVQVPGDGQPLIFLADHPTTGGYPVIGVVEPAALPALGQARPGEEIRFRLLGPSSSGSARKQIG